MVFALSIHLFVCMLWMLGGAQETQCISSRQLKQLPPSMEYKQSIVNTQGKVQQTQGRLGKKEQPRWHLVLLRSFLP